MNKKSIYTPFLLVIVMLSLSAKSQKVINYKITDFPEKKSVKGEKVFLNEPLKNPYKIFLLDSLLFVENINTSPAIDIYNLNTKNIVARFCIRGRGSGELISPFSIQFLKEDNEIMVQDATAKKLVYFDLNLILANANKNFVEVVNIDEVMVAKIQQIKGGNYFCCLIGSKDGYMTCMLNENGHLGRYLEQFPKIETKFNPLIGSNLFQTNIGVSSNKEIIIVPFRNSDKIDIYNSSGDHKLQLIGPNYKKLDVIYANDRIYLTNKNNEAFNIPCANNEYFMVPYSGDKPKYSHTPANNIFCFDFEGNLKTHYSISPSVTEIAVDWKRKIFYSINMDEEPTLYQYKF